MFGRVLLGLALCFNAAAGDGAGGGGTTNAAPVASAPAPAPPPIDPEKVKSEARLAVLKDLGFDSEDAYKKHLQAKADEENAKLSDLDKHKKLYNEALDARGKAEEKLESEKAARKAAEAALAMRDRLDAHGVLPGERKFVEVELRDAEAAAKKAAQAFDEAKFFEELRGKRPYFFSKDAPQLANTGTNADAGAKNGTTRTTPSGLTFDAGKLSADEWAKWRRDNHV